MATLYEETGGFTVFVEDLDYTSYELMKVWPSRFDAPTAAAYAGQPQKIANYVYANRDGNGNTASGDGWTFRGRGPMQVTFRDGYAQAAKATGLDLVNNPDLMLSAPAGAASAASFWKQNNCNTPADAGNMEGVTKIVNGGLTNLPARIAALSRWQSVVANSPTPAAPTPVQTAAVQPLISPLAAPQIVPLAPTVVAPVAQFTTLENTLHVIIAAFIPIFGSLYVLFVRWERAQQAARAVPAAAPQKEN